MKIYLAPMEGITGFIYRRALNECFGGFDKYFIPFIRPNQNGHFSSREKKDVSPENNRGMYAVPQILTNSVEDFLRTAEKLRIYGYREVNLNLGCPSRTVVTKGRGAGFLAEPEKLEHFLDEIFKKCPLVISVKTRLGMEEPEEFGQIIKIYNRFPLKELIIHPRVQKDFYKNTPALDAFEIALKESSNPVCYNGDLFSVQDYEKFSGRFPEVECVMTGRGTLADPALARKLKGGKGADKAELKRFHDMIYTGYCEEMSGDRTILYKMKEFWSYLAPIFPESRKYAKKIKKSEKCRIYEEVVEDLFQSEEIENR